jgi:hypothetical protein
MACDAQTLHDLRATKMGSETLKLPVQRLWQLDRLSLIFTHPEGSMDFGNFGGVCCLPSRTSKRSNLSIVEYSRNASVFPEIISDLLAPGRISASFFRSRVGLLHPPCIDPPSDPIGIDCVKISEPTHNLNRLLLA